MSTDVVSLLLEGLLASSAACLLVLTLRRPWRRIFGASGVPLLWALVPAAWIAVALPAPATAPGALQWITATPQNLQALQIDSGGRVDGGLPWALLGALWLLGALLSAARFTLQQRRFIRAFGPLKRIGDGVLLGSSAQHGPAVIGLLRPRILLPADFDSRFEPQERELILAHERSHLRRGDIVANAVATLLRTIYWFNPLIHYAAVRMRHDHELASDADVLAQYPHARRRYADTLLNAQLAVPGLPVGCLWQSSHPLKERIQMIKRDPQTQQRQRLGRSITSLLLVSACAMAWAAQPGSNDTQANSNGASVDVSYAQMKPPRYPATAIEAKQHGKVVLRVLVGEDGLPQEVDVESTSAPGVFDLAAKNAVATWRFNPAMRDGRAIASWVLVPMCFSLEEESASCEAVADNALDGIWMKPPAG